MQMFKLKFFNEHNRTSSGKKTVTGVQVVTTSRVQNYQVWVAGHFVLTITDTVSVCQLLPKSRHVECDAECLFGVPVGVLVGDKCVAT